MAGSGSRLAVDSPSPAEQTSSPQRRQHEPAFRGLIATEPTTHGNNGITPARYVSLLGTIRDNVREIVPEQWQPCHAQAWNQVLAKVDDPDACCPKSDAWQRRSFACATRSASIWLMRKASEPNGTGIPLPDAGKSRHADSEIVDKHSSTVWHASTFPIAKELRLDFGLTRLLWG
jgi:hypothetical protein